jgi:hypothetical protein
MVRKGLCHKRIVQMTLRPYFRNCDACGENLRLCTTRTTHGRVETSMLRVTVRRCVYAKGCSKSFGGRLVHIRAIQAWISARRAWSSAEEFAFEVVRPCRLRALNALPLPAHVFRAGRGRGEWGSSPQASGLLKFTAVKINCNG